MQFRPIRTVGAWRLATAWGAALVIAGCARRVEPHGGDGGAPAVWRATLRTQLGDVAFATLTSDGSRGETRAELRPNAWPWEGEWRWHVHRGTCQSRGEVVGGEAAYGGPQRWAAAGARLTVALPFVLEPGEPYVVDVHSTFMDRRNDATFQPCGPLRLA